MTWKTFGRTAVIVFFSLVTWGGGFAAGLTYPELLVIGTAAPVNPEFVVYPNFTASDVSIPNQQIKQYITTSTSAAIANVAVYEKKIGAHVNVTISDVVPNFNNTGETRYRIHYRYTVRGLDMGLQHLSQLVLHVEGQCNFEDSWYTRIQNSSIPNGGELEMYNLWPSNNDNASDWPFTTRNQTVPIPIAQRQAPFAKFHGVLYNIDNDGIWDNQKTGKTYYTITPSTTKRMSYTEGTDAWYATQLNPIEPLRAYNYTYEVNPGRPPLRCQEDNRWSYKNWQGTIADFLTETNNAPPFTTPQALNEILSTQLIVPAIVNVGRSNMAAALKSATRVISPDNVLYAGTESAEEDIRRLVYAAFITTKDIFRHSAVSGVTFGNKSDFDNVLQSADGSYMQGAGDFILVTRHVVALSFVQTMVVPAILVVLLLISTSVRVARKAIKLQNGEQGRFKRFILYASGFEAAQMYRMLDEALAEDGRAPTWSNHRGWTPFVTSDTQGVPVPEPHVPENSSGSISMRLRSQRQYQPAGLDYSSKSTSP
ncbi:hypothetical protein BDZ91DRAFT_831932 [Kalaharituber pfeilii]|nr:hypothetical protein BDZ91DRAFT_831929 [Kalaharituber pfeilii]KAF8460823.1 hypothetical protein BDZ91DRAFT_831932 [Kalaharituber pfeilii]